MSKENTIHVGFGFHVNCYHSYRGDTPDGLGFGSDIRIIRHIIEKLNELNEEGIPVKATWDSENFFSLEKILPKHAPDIIEGIRFRTEKYGDENIIMGYSNGALSAMNEDELTASIKLAVTNPQGSGIADLFGKCEMTVRPQEVMFTPSDVAVYKKCGVRALCLYYSCVPFDAFRTIIPLLDDEKAYNPLIYSYKGDEITIIPTYSNADICDAGCLRKWVKDLRKKQESGEINRDLFIFINMDADAIFWETMNLPLVGHRIANTDGIHGLVKEIADLDYIVFDTPGGYLDAHSPAGKIDFTQDTADGNFTGYASWSEKPYNRKIWTAIERSRAMSRVNAQKDSECASFNDRVLLLSTTHFGLATPVLNIEREKTANELAERIIKNESASLPETDRITVHNINGSLLQSAQLKYTGTDKAESIGLKGDGLEDYIIIPVEDKENTVFALMKFGTLKDKYIIEVAENKSDSESGNLSLETGKTIMEFDPEKCIKKVTFNGSQIGGEGFLQSYLTYSGKKYKFDYMGAKALPVSGNGKAVRVTGEIHLPGEISGGSFIYDFYTFGSYDSIFIKSSVKYPYTPENDSISTENSTLGRFTDMKWSEAVPFMLTPLPGSNKRIIKRNFMGDISSYRADSFRKADEKNKSLDSFNHHLTGGFIGIADNKHGMLLANSRQVLNSMAHCPMRLDESGDIHLNPFGHFYGKQRHHIGRGKDEILNVYTLIAPQGKSLAPAYNGVEETAIMMLKFFDGAEPDKDTVDEACAFADGCVITAPADALLTPYYGDNVCFTEFRETGETGEKMKNPVLNGIQGNLLNYITKGSKAVKHIIKAQRKSK